MRAQLPLHYSLLHLLQARVRAHLLLQRQAILRSGLHASLLASVQMKRIMQQNGQFNILHNNFLSHGQCGLNPQIRSYLIMVSIMFSLKSIFHNKVELYPQKYKLDCISIIIVSLTVKQSPTKQVHKRTYLFSGRHP